MEQVVTTLQQQLSSQQQARYGRAAGKRSSERKCFASSVDRLVGPLEPEHGRGRIEVEPEPVAHRHRAFIESRAFSKLANFDSKAASWKDWSFKFENIAGAVVPSSRESLEWAAQQETPISTVDDVVADPDSVEINPQVYVALAELLEGEALDIVQNTLHEAQVWKLGGNS